ncbi:MAG: PQQ-dependent sugar dehydrogenase [Solirubrobacteraceae bacterium]|nr:PQQ-dependent sugar dehydrogenase [Solirubrobacteraceae bacterium]
MTSARWFAVTALLTGSLAGCGSGDDEGGATGERPAATTAQSAPPSSSPETTPPSAADPSPVDAPDRGEVRLVAKDLEVPWDVDFLPNGDALVTERDTRKLIRIPADGGPLETVMTVPGVVPDGEGGLLGLAVSPQYAQDGRVFVYFTAAGDNRVARIDMDRERVTPILTGLQKASNHNGGGLAFGPDGKLYVAVGDAAQPDLAQDQQSLNGKILRIDTDGSAAEGNPFPGSRIWSLGHRNVQGLAWDSADRLWATEFGQNTVDEVNLIRRGRNYGWPVVEGRGDGQNGQYTNPSVTWSPTSESSPSGAGIVGDELYVGALAGRRVWRVKLEETTAGDPESLLDDQLGRIRGVTRSPRGTIWITTSNRDGRGDPADIDDRILELGVDE